MAWARPAECGNLQGAVLNVVTKSGSNQLKGLGNWFSQYQGLTDNNTPDEDLPYHRDRFNDATIQIGGPLQLAHMPLRGCVETDRPSPRSCRGGQSIEIHDRAVSRVLGSIAK